MSRSLPPCGAAPHRRELTGPSSLPGSKGGGSAGQSSEHPIVTGIRKDKERCVCTAADDRAGLKDVRPDAFWARSGLVIDRSPARRALCAARRINPRPESSNPSGARFRPPTAARRATADIAFHASGHCGGHPAHQQRTPAFAHPSGRPRVQLSDAARDDQRAACETVADFRFARTKRVRGLRR